MVCSRPTILVLALAAWLGSIWASRADAEQPDAQAFRQNVEPLLAKFCVKCHGGDEPKGELALAGYLERASIAADRETWDKIEKRLRAGEMPPEDATQPSQAERQQIIDWIGAGLAASDCGRERDPGRVTIRRLNRNEYNNTIRDLVGVDFHPADDFPSDDVGYGFDHIGDVLALPPILLEKYLAAAERIVDRALGTDAANLAGDELEGGQPLDRGQRILTSEGEITTKARMTGRGDYLLRVRAYGHQAGDEPVRMGLYLDGKLARKFEVRAVEDRPQTYETWVTTRGGQRTFSVGFLNDYYMPDRPGPNDRNLVVGKLEVVGPLPETYKQIIPREHTPEDKLMLASEVIEVFMTRAFRRPVTRQEVDRAVKLFELADAEGESFAASLGLALRAILVSPHFLFRVEPDPATDAANAVRELNDYELATRLSYFLWSSMPDDELFALARKGMLRREGNLDRQVKRMLADPKSQALIDNFAGQWLQLRNLKTVMPDRGVYPDFDDALRQAMQKETELFFAAIVREDRSVLDFIDADFTFVNQRLARHYGMNDVQGDEFRRVAVDPERRGGVLAQASVLTVTSNPTRTSPVKRGKWVLENLLGTPPPPPPDDVPPLAEDKGAALTGSLRQRMEQHRANAVCASCHKAMDPLGFGLENYDGIGAWRDTDGNFKIDPSGELPNGQTFSGPRQLKNILKGRQNEFLRCLAEKMLTYGLGRGVEYSDRCTLDDITRAMEQNGYKYSSLVLAVVHSDAFGKRKAKGSQP
jgi:hypothetical protein